MQVTGNTRVRNYLHYVVKKDTAMFQPLEGRGLWHLRITKCTRHIMIDRAQVACYVLKPALFGLTMIEVYGRFNE